MSIDAAIAFIEKVNEDDTLATAVQRLEAGTFVELSEVARTAGYEFSLEDWIEGVKALGGISDEALDQVVGGTGTAPAPTNPSATSPKLSPAISPVLKPYVAPQSWAQDGWGTVQ